MGAWNKDGWHGYWHVERPHAVMAHMVGMGGKHQQGKKLGFKVPVSSAHASFVALRAPACCYRGETGCIFTRLWCCIEGSETGNTVTLVCRGPGQRGLRTQCNGKCSCCSRALDGRTGAQVARWWHYEATQMLQGQRLFRSSTDAQPFPRMLVLDPAVLVKAATREELLAMYEGLVLAGLLSHRVWRWPLLDCTSWRIQQKADHWTGVYDPTVIPYGGTAALACYDLDMTWNHCMEVRI